MLIPSELPGSLLPPETVQICPLAVLEHATVSVAVEYERGGDLTASSSATARVMPRSSLYARLKGSHQIIETVDEVVEAEVDIARDGLVDPIPLARNRAVAAVLFQHLATNCLECPRAERCDQRALLGSTAWELAQ